MRYAAKPLIVDAHIWSGDIARAPAWLEQDPSFRYDAHVGALFWIHDTGTYSTVEIGSYLVYDSGTGITCTYVIDAKTFRASYEPVVPTGTPPARDASLQKLWSLVQVYAAHAELVAALNEKVNPDPDWQFAKLAARADVQRAWSNLKDHLAVLERLSNPQE